jgi:hypothetical protein
VKPIQKKVEMEFRLEDAGTNYNSKSFQKKNKEIKYISFHSDSDSQQKYKHNE